MNRINRYIFRHLAISTVIATAVLVFAIWLTQSLRLIEVIVDGSAPIWLFLKLVGLAMPEFLITVLPIGSVAAVLFTYHRLTADSELVVMRASGMGPMRLARPALMMAGTVVAISYVFNLYLWPLASQEFRKLSLLVESQYATVFLHEGQFNPVDDDITVYFARRRQSEELTGILIHDNRNRQRPVTIVAERGLLMTTGEGPRVIMFDGNRQEMDRENGRLDVLYFDQYAIDLEVIRPDLRERWAEPDERFIGDLLSPDLSHPHDVRKYVTLVAEGHSRLSSPLWVIAYAMAALGVLLSGEGGRRIQGRRIGVCAALLVVLQALSMSLSGLTRVDLDVAPLMYLTPVLVAVAGAMAMYRPMPRRRSAPAALPATA